MNLNMCTEVAGGRSRKLQTNNKVRQPLQLGARQIRRLRHYLESRRVQKINRDAFKHLLSLDDSMLKDIGLTKGDVMWASELPKSQNAAIELEIVARRRGKHNL